MKEIQGKSTLVRVSARFELSGRSCVIATWRLGLQVQLVGRNQQLTFEFHLRVALAEEQLSTYNH